MKPDKPSHKPRIISKNISDKQLLQIANRKKQEQLLYLEYVIGITPQSMHSIQFNKQIDDYFYPSGSVIVQYNLQANKQKRFYYNPNKRPITSLCFTPDGKYLISGEGICKNPEIQLWNLDSKLSDITQDSKQRQQITPDFSLKGHKFGTHILLTSPNNKYLVSIGDKNDNGLFVWDYMQQVKLTQNKLVRPINSATFSPNSKHLVTVGNNHLKFWDFAEDGTIIKVPVQGKKGAFIMDCTTPSLGQKFQKKEFQDCVFSYDSKFLYAITKCGLLCVIDVDKRILPKWMDLKVNCTFSIQNSNEYVIIGCSDGVIRIFKSDSLSHIITLPKIPPLQKYNIVKGGQTSILNKQDDQYADCISLRYDSQKKILYSTFSDRSIFIWDLKQIEKPYVKRSFLNHSNQITNIEMLEQASSEEACFFATTSSDLTIRIWNYLNEQNESVQIDKSINSNVLKRNIYCRNLSQIFYLSQNMDHFKVGDQQKLGENLEQNSFDQAKVIKSSQDGKYLVSGDVSGQIKIYHLSNFSLLKILESHDQEITCIDFVPININGIKLCATGSRDRLIHIYEQENNFNHICTLGDHNSTIICLKFVYLKNCDKIILISCSKDKTIIFRQLNISLYNQIQNQGQSGTNVNQKLFTLIRREVDKNHKIFCLTPSFDQEQVYVGQEKIISIFNCKNGLQSKIIETKEKDNKTGKLYNLDNQKFAVDSTGSYLATYNNDKFIRIREILSGNIIAKISQGDQITSMAFSFNNKNLITTTDYGSIHIWQMSQDITSNINRKISTLGQIVKHMKNFFTEQQLLKSKEWTINSFWIEEELNNNLNNKTNYIPLTQKNIEPSKLMKNDNLPQWAMSIYQQSQDENIKKINNFMPEQNMNNISYLNDQEQLYSTQILVQQNQNKINHFDLLISDDKQYDFMNGSQVDQELNISDEVEQSGFADDATESQVYPNQMSEKQQNAEDQYKDNSKLCQRKTISKIYNSQQCQNNSYENLNDIQQHLQEEQVTNKSQEIEQQEVLQISINNQKKQSQEKGLQNNYDMNQNQNQIDHIDLNVQTKEDELMQNEYYPNQSQNIYNCKNNINVGNMYTVQVDKQVDDYMQKLTQQQGQQKNNKQISNYYQNLIPEAKIFDEFVTDSLQYSQSQKPDIVEQFVSQQTITSAKTDLQDKNEIQQNINSPLIQQKNKLKIQTLFKESSEENYNNNKQKSSLTPPKQQKQLITMQGKLTSLSQQNLIDETTETLQTNTQAQQNNLSQITTISQQQNQQQNIEDQNENENKSSLCFDEQKNQLKHSFQIIINQLENIDSILSESESFRNMLLQTLSHEISQTQTKVEQLEQKGVSLSASQKGPFKDSQQFSYTGQQSIHEQVIGNSRDLLENYSKELLQLITKQMDQGREKQY